MHTVGLGHAACTERVLRHSTPRTFIIHGSRHVRRLMKQPEGDLIAIESAIRVKVPGFLECYFYTFQS